nr:endochitinase A-like isoform X1 [Ipomoea batatas]
MDTFLSLPISSTIFLRSSQVSATIHSAQKWQVQERTLGMVMKEVDEDLAIFLQRRHNGEERKHYVCPQNDLIVEESRDDQRYLVSNETLTRPATQMAMEKFLSSENEEGDYEWLLSPPRVPSYSSSDTEEQKAIANPTRTSSDSAPLKYTSTDSVEDKTSQNMSSVHPSTATSKCASLPNKNASRAGSGRPSAEARKSTSSRSATPTRQQRAPSRASTPSSRASLVSAKPVAVPTRSSTPVRANSRSSTPTARATVSATSRSASRSATPTHRPSTTSSSSAVSARSSSVPKRAPTMSRNLSSSSGTKSLSRDDSTKRPSSASRARPSSPLLRPSTTNNTTDEISRCKSHSSSRSKTPTITAPGSGSTSVSRSRGHSVNKDDVNPVLAGTKMVERVVNMRKLAPAKPDGHLSNKDASKKSSYSQESSGFGTSFSKKALDMALRHMDIKRRTPGNLRPVSTGAPPAPVNGV